jgi:hypothetical protein
LRVFESLYGSPWQHPGIAFFAASVFVLVRARSQSFLAGWATLFLFTIAADAMVTGGFAPVPKGTPLEQNLAVAFVILGDFRYFLVVEAFAWSRAAPHGLGPPRAWLVAAILAFVVPVLSLVSQRVWPAFFSNARHIFLQYELMMFVLVGVMRFVVLPRRLASFDVDLRAWLYRVTTFVIVQYGLWATADVLILSGVEAGFLLRIVPNALYYGAFVPYVFLSAPGSARAT